MPVDPVFQKQVLAKIAEAKPAGGTELDHGNIERADAQATEWALTQITDEEDGLPLLTTLYLGGKGIGAAGAKALARALIRRCDSQ